MKKYNHTQIEKKWQREWEKNKLYEASDISEAKKFYSLIEFPFPSGAGLHTGHIRSNTAMDIISRKRRMEGYNVLYPIGWDAFGLPTENYALKTGKQPAKVTKENTDNFRRQLKALGFSFDWSREINTTDPSYYRWTQWIFLQMYKKGLAYKAKMNINWCPKDKIGLANEEVVDGCCERCGTVVEKREKEQWMLAITKYAERLLNDLDAIDYVMPELVDKVNPHEPGKPLVERKVAHAIIFDPKNKKYLIIRNKKFGWDTVVIGGIEGEEDPVEAARREVREETGYTDLEFKRLLGGQTKASYYAKHKGENRVAYATAVYFELKSEAKVPLAEGEDEQNEILWIDEADFVPGKMVNSELHIWLERLKDPTAGFPKPLLNWTESIKVAQRNWIGRSEGMLFTAPVKDTDLKIQTFSAHFEACYADTFVVIAPDHPFLNTLLEGVDEKDSILEFCKTLVDKRNAQGFGEEKESEGIFTGRYIVDPLGNGDLPIWVASFALADYGTGIVKCSAHDERDFKFAKKYNIPLKTVLYPEDKDEAERVRKFEVCFTDMKSGILSEPEEFEGKGAGEVKQEIIEYLIKHELAAKKTTYKLKDWVFSRQRYWGEPIPMIYCEKCSWQPVPEKDLPVELPKVEKYEPTDTGESPLASVSKWLKVKCPQCDGEGRRETDTMPNWAGSSWYYLRYTDPKNDNAFADAKKLERWLPVDWYNGGREHTTLHLLYSRFWHKFLYDEKLVPTKEPYAKRTSHGLILAEGGEKMSKSKGNVVNPDDLVTLYGADSLRVYEMFIGPFEQAVAWSSESIIGSRRFIERVWNMQDKLDTKATLSNDAEVLLNQTVKKVGEDIESMAFNTAISSLMILLNKLEKEPATSIDAYKIYITLLAPFAPHISEEIWALLGGEGSIHQAPWPTYDPLKLASDTVTIAIQVNGKVRGELVVGREDETTEVIARAKALPEVEKWLSGKTVKKEIYVKRRLISLVVD